MIQVSIAPTRLVAGRRSQLEISFANTGSGACTDIVFKLVLPSGVALVSGQERIEIEMIRPGRTTVRRLAVEARRPGKFTLSTPNFSYRDPDDEPVRDSDWSCQLLVDAAEPVQPRIARPAPQLRAENDGDELAVDKWGVLSIRVGNSSGVGVSEVSVTISGPIETFGKPGKIPMLLDGQAHTISFNVKAPARGLVPISVRMTYSYPDGLGSLRPWSQEDQVTVMVGESAGAEHAVGARGKMEAGIRKLCVAYDVENYSGRGTRGEYATQQRLSDILELCFEDAGVPRGNIEIQEQGDGGIAFLRTGGAVDEPRLLVDLINSLRTRLTELNEDLVEQARVRLRIGLHEGVVHRAPHGYVGPAVIEVCRLRDADAVKKALAGSDASMVVAAADTLYRDVLSHGYHGLPAAAFAPTDVQVKSYRGRAWIYLAGTSPAPRASARALGVKTILYLTASPRGMDPLRSDLEMRKVQEKLQLGRERDSYRLEYRGASRLDDVSQALYDYEPRVVHFSGHGDEAGGLYVEDEIGRSSRINPDGLARMFGQHRDTIDCVIVNACHSAKLAETVTHYIDHAIGMRWAIGDAAAIQFSVGFYQAMFAGRSVPEAFERGCTMVESNSATGAEYLTPVLFPTQVDQGR